jgi:HPt (histidine-containing phosphotransfer) domain-containing protein
MVLEAIEDQDPTALQHAAHTLKGALGSLAAPVASGIAAELEEMGRTDNIALAPMRLNELEDELVRVFEALEDMCAETRN